VCEYAADGYMNLMLLLLYLLPWSQVRMFGWVGEGAAECGGVKTRLPRSQV
jgi:hypothetical protein